MMTRTSSQDKARKASVIGQPLIEDVFLLSKVIYFSLSDLCLGVPRKWRHSVDSCFALGIVMVKTRSTRDNLKLDKGKYLPKG